MGKSAKNRAALRRTASEKKKAGEMGRPLPPVRAFSPLSERLGQATATSDLL